jgi:LysM repeat protein
VRVWTKSACVVLAWSALPIMVAAGMSRSHPAQAETRIASNSNSSSSSGTGIILAGTVSMAAVPVRAVSPAARYVVQPGDTLSGIAARLAVRGGWAGLYAANRPVIGPDPDVIGPGTVLVLPGGKPVTRYVVGPGDTLSAIAAALAVRGGWPALYAANRRVIGADPDVIRAGTVLAIPGPAVRPPAGHSPGPRVSPRPRPAPVPVPVPAGSGHRPGPVRVPAAGMPSWLRAVLLAAGLLIGAAFVAEPVLAVRRRRAAARAARATPAGAAPAGAALAVPGQAGSGQAVSGQAPARRQAAEGKARIVVGDYDRVVVTCSTRDGTVYVLRPPGAEPAAILQAARLVLREGPYRQLAGHLGMPAEWPIVVADYDRLVVTCSPRDGTVYVLRPPGEDPRAILRAARLVLPEWSYGELADQLGVPAAWPMEDQSGMSAGWAAQ